MIKLEDFAPESCLDDKTRALCAALDAQIDRLISDSICVLHLPRLDELSGKILDVLADQLHVDNFSPYPLSDAIKKNLIRNSIADHRLRGTPFAVEKVCDDLNHEVTLSEWFDNGDAPGWFRLDTVPFYDADIFYGWLRAVLIAKNVRSHCKVRFHHYERTALYFGIADFIRGKVKVNYLPPPDGATVKICAGIMTFIRGTIRVGIAADDHAATVIPYCGMASFIGGFIRVGKAGD